MLLSFTCTNFPGGRVNGPGRSGRLVLHTEILTHPTAFVPIGPIGPIVCRSCRSCAQRAYLQGFCGPIAAPQIGPEIAEVGGPSGPIRAPIPSKKEGDDVRLPPFWVGWYRSDKFCTPKFFIRRPFILSWSVSFWPQTLDCSVDPFWLICLLVWFVVGPGGCREGPGSLRNPNRWPWGPPGGPRTPLGPSQNT